MNTVETVKSSVIKLYELYEKKWIVKALIQSITVKDLPIGAAGDTILSSYVTNLKAERLRTFFDQLDNGDIELTEELIANDDYLHAYFATVNYVLQNRSKLKIKAFADILKSLYRDDINIDEFEDYGQIFDELTEREFIILSVKYEFEKHAATVQDNLNPLQRTSSYWEDFKSEVKAKLNVEGEDLNAMLLRLQRTGCYKKHQGYWDESHEEVGDTTAILQTIINVIKYKEPEPGV
ncbi:MAG: hypothetical protein ABIN91_00080 [Mucilaginibacter sp.]|uniref:hypothetical protein n=1 Tax=Mucilaginibacter sp. TaxID=1882438 RepID=UPI00326404E8